ncbi:MAG: DMT family transporter [Pseudomonadota bacterium]
MEKKDHIDLLGGSCLVAFSALLGLNQVMVKLVNAGLQPAFQAGLRSLCAVVPVLLFALIAKRRLSISDGSLPMGVLAGVLFAAEFLLIFLAVEYTTVARVSVLFYSMPVWVALAAHFLLPGERLTSMRAIGLLLAVGGVVLALADGPPADSDALLGDLMALCGSFFWAAIALMARTTSFSRSSPEMQLLYQLIISAPVLLVAALFFGDFFREPTAFHWMIFAVQVFVVISVGFLTWFWILSIYPTSDMASFGFLAPVFGVFFGWLVLKEEISASIIIALILVGMGIYLVNRKPKST